MYSGCGLYKKDYLELNQLKLNSNKVLLALY